MSRRLPEGYDTRASIESWPEHDMEIRAIGDGFAFSGYAAMFDTPSEDLGGFREIIRPGAFTRTLRERRSIFMLWNHNQDVVLASTKSKTLRLTEDERGLRVEADLPDDEWGRPVANAIREGRVESMSFGFAPVVTIMEDQSLRSLREQVEVKLFEVSPVVWPAYRATSATVRHLAEVAGEDPDAIQSALDALRGTEPLSEEYRDLLIRAIHARSGTRYVTEDVADFIARQRERLARLTH